MPGSDRSSWLSEAAKRLTPRALRPQSRPISMRSPSALGDRRTERLGQATLARPAGRLIWLHSEHPESIAPAAALAAALGELCGETVHILATTGTDVPPPAYSARGAIHQFVPTDNMAAVTRFSDHWHPDAAVYLDEPMRITLIEQANKRGIPLFLAASERRGPEPRARIWRKETELFARFDRCLAASAADAIHLERLGANPDHVETIGPLTDTAVARPCNRAEHDTLTKLLGGRPIWLAAEITTAEVSAIESAQRAASKRSHRLLLILVPKVPEDGVVIGEALESQGWRTARRSDGDEPDDETQIYIADTDGEMGLWLRLSPITFLGGTLDQSGEAVDPFGPAALGSAILHGPNTGDLAPRYLRLGSAGAALRIGTGEQLGNEVFRLLAPDTTAQMAHAGWSVASQGAYVVDRLAELIDAELLDRGAN